MPSRRSPRLPDWDYALVASTFVTFCTRHRGSVLGVVSEGSVLLNRLGRMCAQAIASVPDHAVASIDCSIVMPDHVHAIVLTHDGGADVRQIVGAIKAQVARRSGAAGLWQRSFYDHAVRDEADLDRVREYILTNPIRWSLARELGQDGTRAGRVPPLRRAPPIRPPERDLSP